MFLKIIVNQGEIIFKLSKQIRSLQEENGFLKFENEDLRKTKEKSVAKERDLSIRISNIKKLVENFDYRKSNSITILRKIKNELL